MATRKDLPIQLRTVKGRKVRAIRKEGFTPANVYGSHIESFPLQAPTRELQKFLQDVGESEIINLRVEGEKDPRPVLLSMVQRDPLTRDLVHVDFRQVDLSEEVTVEVEIVFQGESPATKTGEAVLLELMDKIEVTALPDKLPSELVVDVSSLENIGDHITVAGLNLPEGAKVDVDPEQLVCKVDAVQIKEEVVEEAPVEEEGGVKEEGAEAETETPKEETTE